MNPKTKSQLFTNAVQAYISHCERNPVAFQQPSKERSLVGWKYVHLRNVNGDLARYNHRDGVIVEIG